METTQNEDFEGFQLPEVREKVKNHHTLYLVFDV
jgi:hypothetical protein